MTTRTWTLTIVNSTTETVQAPNGLDLLTGGNPTGAPPQWTLAPNAQTTLQCVVNAAQRNSLIGMMTWAGPSGTATLNWNVPATTGDPAYNPACTGYGVAKSGADLTGVTYTISGGPPSSAPADSSSSSPPQGIPVRVTPNSGSSSLAKPDAPQLWILGDTQGMPLTHFNCGNFGDKVADKLIGEEEEWQPAVDNPHDEKGNARKSPDGSIMAHGKNTHYRTLQTSGCGLFALSTILGAYNVIVPDWDPTTGFKSTAVKGTVDMRTPLASPRAFLHFIWHYVIQNNSFGIATEAQAKEDQRPKILAPDGPGALWFADGLSAALAFLFAYNPLQYDDKGNYLSSPLAFGMTFSTTKGSWPSGTEIKEVTDSIVTQHQPVIIGIGGKGPSHQVLAVGLVKYGGKTYYITIDSGFSGGIYHPGGLLTMNVPLSWAEIVKFTVSEKAAWKRPERPNIFWWRSYAGGDAFNSAFDLSLVCKQVREW